ncbi:MAG: SRPBCC family protein [Actinobacteria bacterium]|nr:SRPBCC family protein [Actinomycetota bacterium]
MTTVRVSIELPQAPETVFAFLADPTNDPSWCSAVPTTEYVGGAPAGEVGARYRFTEGFKPEKALAGEVEITALEPPRRMESVATTPRRRYVLTYELEPTPGGGTRLTQTAQARFAGAAGRFTGLFKPLIALQYRRQFRALARVLADRG